MSDPAFTLDTIFKIGEIVSLLGGFGIIAYKVGGSTSRVEVVLKQQATEITELKNAVKELSKISTGINDVNTRVTLAANRLDLLDKRYEELRHGEGFTFPLADVLDARARARMGGLAGE